MKASVTLATVGGMIIVLGAAALLLSLMPAFVPGAGFFYSGCEGAIEASIVTSQSGYNYSVPGRCLIYDNADKGKCEGAYSTIFNNSRPFCIWIDDIEVSIDQDQYYDRCVLNPEVSCEELSPETTPECSDVPRCKPINIIKRMMENIL